MTFPAALEVAILGWAGQAWPAWITGQELKREGN
jgi:hypothetical protein